MSVPMIIDTDPGVDDAVAHMPAAASPEVELLASTPLDLTLRATVDAAWLSTMAAAGPRCDTLAGIVEHYRARFRETTGREAVALHDSLAVLEAAVPGTLRTTAMPLEVGCDHGPARGTVWADSGRHPQAHLVQMALDADLPAISATILNRLCGLR